MKGNPLVSIICLCYNHERYVERAVMSALGQTYGNLEIIVIDDASRDGSRAVIEKLAKIHGFKAIFNEQNLGNCRTFNKGLALAKGDYVIDLAADDVLLPDRVAEGVNSLEGKGPEYGVHFCDIELIDEKGHSLGAHFPRDEKGDLVTPVQEGDLYKIILEKYYIPTPAMMMRRSVLEEMGGYDEGLSYEDFDFWVRSARNYKYAFTDRVLMQKHVLSGSLSTKQKLRKNPHLLSTAIVCEKALKLNKTENENQALLKRINYELKWALATENWEAAELFLKIKKQLGGTSPVLWIQKMAIKTKPRWYGFLKLLFSEH